MGLILAIDKFNTAIGKLAGWTILILTFAMSYEVFARYALRAPTEWAFDVSYILYGTLFMLAGPYALARNAHVRGDFLYRQWSPTRQAKLDLALYVLFFFPGIVALAWSGYHFAAFSWLMREIQVARTRSSSCGSKRGRRSMSAKSPSDGSRFSVSADSVAVAPSRNALASTTAPSDSARSAKARAPS